MFNTGSLLRSNTVANAGEQDSFESIRKREDALANNTDRVATLSLQRKTRTGCIRCKSRRVKCDEARPQCQRCIKIKVLCPGYDIPKTRLFGLSTNECFESDYEKLCFNSFVAVGTHDLIEFQPTVRSFWQAIVPQLGQLYPAIRHATIAISVLIESMTRTRQALQDSRQNIRAAAIWHFNQAIRGFLDAENIFRIEARLTSCILFHILTKHLDHVPAGAAHVRAADFFLKDHERRVLSGSEVDGGYIALNFRPMIQQYILDASTYLDRFQLVNMDCGNRFEMFQDFVLRIPQRPTIPEMHETLGVLIEYAIGSHLRDFWDPQLLTGLRLALAQYQVAITHIENLATVTNATTIYFKMHYCAAYIFLHSLRSSEKSFDLYLEQFAEICNLGERLLQGVARPFGVTLGYIPPLFLTATKCRNNAVRSRALSLLHATHCVENAWTSCIATTLADFTVQYETRSLGKRLSLFNVSYSNDEDNLVVAYDESGNTDKLPQRHYKTLPMQRPIVSDPSFGRIAIQDRVLWAAGYSGVIMVAPRIPCHCQKDSVNHPYTGLAVSNAD